MNNSNETMPEKITTLHISTALIFAGKFTAIFLPIFTLYIFSTALMVGAEGSVSGVVNLTGQLIDFPAKLLNSSGGAYAVQACIFWTLVVYVGLFLKSLYISGAEKNKERNDLNRIKAKAFFSIIFFISILSLLIVWR